MHIIRTSVSVYLYEYFMKYFFVYICDYLTLTRTMESIFAWQMYTTFHFSLSRYVWIRRKIAKKTKIMEAYHVQSAINLINKHIFLLMIWGINVFKNFQILTFPKSFIKRWTNLYQNFLDHTFLNKLIVIL